ncbi:hypothetical protein DPMN_159148 [Dreissena polymorpha]|uniref:Uncharacterized protein n=1 Tax=Dreissena polymorpha TaxID=45954 RepID=A0A9D4EKI5_DREPO|nr:hypothetical protein DPMN_159148 [Dreissena polymorpha]
MVCVGANTVSAPARDFQTIFDGARQFLRSAGNLKQTPRKCATLPDSLPDRRAHARDSHTFCDVPRPSVQLQETPRQSVTMTDSLSLRRRLFVNLLQVPRRSLHRRRLIGSLVQVPRRSERLSDTFWESPAGARTVLAPSQTVWDSSACAPKVMYIVWHRVRVSCRRPDGLPNVIYVWESPAGAPMVRVSHLQVPRRSWHRRRLSKGLLQMPRRSERLSGTVCDSSAGAQTVLAPS